MAKKATGRRKSSKKASAKPKRKVAAKSKKPKKVVNARKKTAVKKTKTKPKTKLKTQTRSAKKKPMTTKSRKKTEQTRTVATQEKELSVAEQRAEKMKKIKGYSKEDLDHFKTIIMEKRDEIIEQLQNLRDQMLDPTTGEYINENSPYSLHMAEQGTDAMEREKTFLYAQRENKFLGYLEDALKRIEAGTYGICIECVDEPQHLCETCPLIPKARLDAVPHSQLCLPIKQRQEKYK